MENSVKRSIRDSFFDRSTKIQIIALCFIYNFWIVTAWPQTLSYDRLCMDSYGTFQYVYPFFWVILLLCIVFLLFSNAHPYIKLLYCIMLGLMTFGTLSLIQQLGTYHDSVPNLTAAIGYFNDGFIAVGSDPRNSYPLTYILWGTLMTVCNIPLECLLKYHAILLTVLYVASGTLLGKYFFKKKQMDDYFVWFVIFILIFGSRFAIRLNPAPQTLGIIASIFFLALAFKPDVKFRIVQMVIFLYICLSHAISTYYVICLLFAIFVAQYVLSLNVQKENTVNTINFQNGMNTIIITTVLFLFWLLYVAIFTSHAALNIAKQLVNIIFQDSSESTSMIPYLYQSDNNMPIEYFVSNRFGWFILLFLVIIGATTIALTVLRKEYEIGLPIISMVGIVAVQFYLSSYATKYGSLLDRSFLFMVIPMGLAFAYFCGTVRYYTTKSQINRLKSVSTIILLILVIFGTFNIYLSHYTDNFNAITPTEIKANEFGRFLPTGGQKIPIYIESKQNFDNLVIVSRQIQNVRAYLEGNLNSTLIELENIVINIPEYELIYTNGNTKYYLRFCQIDEKVLKAKMV